MKVFLSSTAQDLVAYRQVADDTILRLSQQSVVMERFGPLPGEPVAECERKARESDVLICIVAHRYGFEPEKGCGSITRREVEAAKAAGKAVLVWIVAENHPWSGPKEQDLLADLKVRLDDARAEEVRAGVAGLLAFKAWLRATFVCETFTTPDDLGRKIALALANYIATRTPETTAVPKRAEIRIAHALQPAPHFYGRDAVVKELSDWVADPASPDRVWALVAAGGTGKTAIVERVVRGMQPDEGHVLVWSFYEQPECDAFLRECNHLFLGEERGPTGGRLERLERGLRDGRPHLIVLDGLERVQEDVSGGRARGELSDQTLKLLLRVLAAGLGRTRAIVTSRFPLVDLQDWDSRGYRETRLDDLTPEAAVAVLRGWGVRGDESALRAATRQVGYHALSVAVVGSYLKSFASGRIDEVARFDLDIVTGDDPKAAKLARLLAFYAQRLPAEERELMTRLSVFPRGVTLELLGTLIDAGGEVAGRLVSARHRLGHLLISLKARGLVFEYRSETDVTWTAHPFLRDKFRELLGCPVEQVFDVVAQSLRAGLESRPQTTSKDPRVLDRYERLIEATRLAGHEPEALRLFAEGMDFRRLFDDGEYQRIHRILASFSPTGRPQDLGRTIELRARTGLVGSLALAAQRLGRLDEALALRQLDDAWTEPFGDLPQVSLGLQSTCEVTRTLGRLSDAHALADAAVTAVEGLRHQTAFALLVRAMSAHLLGETASARADFAAAATLAGSSAALNLSKGRHHVDLGELRAARALLRDSGWTVYRGDGTDLTVALYDVLLARYHLAEGNDPTSHLESLRTWSSRTGDMDCAIEAHLLSARYFLATWDLQAAVSEAETGLLHAVSCGYQLLRIELLVVLAQVHLAWPDPSKAIQAAGEALNLATHPGCQYAWGEADAAQVWGEAYFANHERSLAQRAFRQALAVRKRIEHPGVAETERWLAIAAA